MRGPVPPWILVFSLSSLIFFFFSIISFENCVSIHLKSVKFQITFKNNTFQLCFSEKERQRNPSRPWGNRVKLIKLKGRIFSAIVTAMVILTTVVVIFLYCCHLCCDYNGNDNIIANCIAEGKDQRNIGSSMGISLHNCYRHPILLSSLR